MPDISANSEPHMLCARLCAAGHWGLLETQDTAEPTLLQKALFPLPSGAPLHPTPHPWFSHLSDCAFIFNSVAPRGCVLALPPLPPCCSPTLARGCLTSCGLTLSFPMGTSLVVWC